MPDHHTILWCRLRKGNQRFMLFMIRFEVEDHTGSTAFAALDSEIQKFVRQTAAELTGATGHSAKATLMSGFSQILHEVVDFQITLNSFNMKQKVPIIFTVTSIYSHALPVHSGSPDGLLATVKVEGNSKTDDLPPTTTNLVYPEIIL
ncbi:hypothetical protein MKX01_016608 [Papaver californicum]|nr:hypothetical protein MKX01_016608 [Papaver californicum]